MHKLSSLALALVIAGGMAAPALAGDSAGFDSGWYVTQLQYKGIDAIDADDGWNGNFRATVRLADGSQVFQYFDRDSLQPVNASKGGNTRVLSRLDTGRTAAPASTDSLLIDNFFD